MNLETFINSKIISDLNSIVASVNVFLEGGCLYKNTEPCELSNLHSNIRDGKDVDILRNNLYSLSKKSHYILQIGLNACHSCALFYHASPSASIVGFDLFNHPYTESCTNYLSFNRRLKLKTFRGNTLDTLPKYETDEKFDLIHIDGGQQIEVLQNDITQCKRFANKYTYIVVDDTNFENQKQVLDEYIQTHMIQEIDYEVEGLQRTPLHRIFHYQW
jgi:predicted O-methyltransferase YrrM